MAQHQCVACGHLYSGGNHEVCPICSGNGRPHKDCLCRYFVNIGGGKSSLRSSVHPLCLIHPTKLSSRHRLILQSLQGLGGRGTTRQIAEAFNLNVNGVSQSLGALSKYVACFGGKAGETLWKFR